MKKIGLVFLLLTFYSHITLGQLLPETPFLSKTIIVTIKQPLIIIGSLETNDYSLIMDRSNLKIIKTYTDSLELVPFGEKGQGGIILAQLQNNIPLLRLDEVLDYYKIPASDRTLKVMVDNNLVNPDLFLADVSAIIKIEKTKQAITSPFLYSLNKDEEYLNIITQKD
ncbi:MAG: hypothetical protein ACO1OF_17030 [Adhaeribacter sp.]